MDRPFVIRRGMMRHPPWRSQMAAEVSWQQNPSLAQGHAPVRRALGIYSKEQVQIEESRLVGGLSIYRLAP